MSIDIDVDGMIEQFSQEGASRLLRTIVFLQQRHMQRVSKPNVKVGKQWVENSEPGEYPRLRTGFGRAGVVYGPDSIQGVIDEGLRVRLGQAMYSWYMAHLEFNRDRLGYEKTADDFEEMARALLTGTAT